MKNGKHIDCEVLSILVKAIDENLLDNYERPSKSFKKAALALFGRITAENNGESRVWQLYSQLVTAAETEVDLNEEELFKAAQLMQKSTATFMQSEKNWHKSSAKITEGLKLAVNYMTSKLSNIHNGMKSFLKRGFFCPFAFSQDIFEVLIQPKDKYLVKVQVHEN